MLVAACGFTPVHAPGGAGGKLWGQIHVADPVSADDHAFLGRLTERLGPETAARYDLAHTLRIAVVPQAITPDEVTTRFSLNGTAVWRLTDRSTGATVAQGEVSNFTSHSTVGTVVATVAAERDARQRLAVMLADQVVTRLMAAVR